MAELPATAAWRHLDAREGFEVLFSRPEEDGYRLEGHVAAVEAGDAWAVRYVLRVDGDWLTRSAHVVSRWAGGTAELLLEGDGRGTWSRNGEPAPEMAGLLDVDLEASAATNALPVRRLGIAIGERVDAPAAYVRVPDLRLERVEQSYARIDDEAGRSRYEYEAPAFDFACRLLYDEAGLVLDYPGIAARVV